MKNTIYLAALCGILLGLQLNISARSKTLFPVQMKKDFAVLKNAPTNLYPEFYLCNSRERIEKYFPDSEAK